MKIQASPIAWKKLSVKMMQIVFLRQAYRFVKRADASLKAKIYEEIMGIQNDPQCGELLHGKLKGLRSKHFSFVKTQYRIAYRIENNIVIIAIGSRENFYRDLLV